MIAEQLIRGSDNQIRIVLTEDGSPLIGNWLTLDIHFGGVTIHRDVNGNGVTLDSATGLLTITPADLTAPEIAAIDELTTSNSYRVQIVITSVLNDDGVVFGGKGSDGIFFFVSDRP